MQLLCSERMKRLWTLQEGRLAANLFIQFRDEAFSINDLSAAELEARGRSDYSVFGTLARYTESTTSLRISVKLRTLFTNF
jgi:hypothetical protein